jgi:hypothetical protein
VHIKVANIRSPLLNAVLKTLDLWRVSGPNKENLFRLEALTPKKEMSNEIGKLWLEEIEDLQGKLSKFGGRLRPSDEFTDFFYFSQKACFGLWSSRGCWPTM